MGSGGRAEQSKHASGASEDKPSFRSHVAPLSLLAGIFFFNFLCRVSLGPLLPTIESDLGLGHGEAGSLFLLLSLGYCVSITCSGFVSSRLGHRRTILVSSVAIGCALLLVVAARSLTGVRLGLILVGMAAGLYLPSGIATLNGLVAPRDWGKAMAIHEVAPNLGFVAAPLLCELFLDLHSWRGALVLFGVASAFVGLAFARFGRGGDFPGEAPRLLTLRVLVAEPAFWIMIALFSLGIGVSLGIYTMLPLYLVAERGMEGGWANTLVALSRISGLGMAFVAGWASDRFGPRMAMGGVLAVTGGLTVMLGLAPGTWVVALVFFQPLIAVCFFPAAFSALSRIGPSEVRNVAVSLTVPVSFLMGGGAIPAGIGLLGEAGAFSLAICLLGLVTMGSVWLLRYLTFGEPPARGVS